MVEEKQKIRQKNSSFIARTIIENNGKFKIISELYQKHKDLAKEKDVIMTKILKIYSLGFKNFSKKKMLLGNIKGKPYYASSKGIVRPVSPRQERNNQTEDIVKTFLFNFNKNRSYQEIADIWNNKEILRKPMNLHQKKIFNGFFKHYRYAKEEPKVIFKTKNPIKVIELTPGFTKPYSYKIFNAISLIEVKLGSDNEYEFNFTMNGQIISTIRFNRLYLSNGITEKILMEQTFCCIKSLFKREIANRQKEVKRLNNFHLKVKERFKDYILLNKIEEE